LGPALVLGLYALIYVQIFKIRAPTLSQGEYVLFIFCGLVPLLSTAEAFQSSLAAIVANKAVLASTVYPIDLTPVSGVLVAQGTMAVGLAGIVIGGALLGTLPVTAPLALVVWALLVMGLVGLGWLLALLNVLVRDLQQLITLLIILLLIASPIAFTPEQVPGELKVLILLNPFAYFVRAFQDVLVLGEVPSPLLWLAMVLIASGLFVAGSWVFDRLKLVVIDHV
jgi:homopolymeric O-antigen transport system permease protein